MFRTLGSAFSIALLVLSVLSCGKEQTHSAKGDEDPLKPINPEPHKQQVFCENSWDCPSFIAKIMVIGEGQRRFCTGTLVSPRIVLTSTSCLPKAARSPDVGCAENVFLFFEKSNDGTPAVVGCRRVLQVSELQGDVAMLWRDDVAFIELESAQHWRRRLAISREGLPEEREYQYYTVDQVDEFKGIIRRQDCRSAFNTYVNPLARHQFSPNMTMSGCTFLKGSSGAPILDGRDRIRGVVSQNMPVSIRTYLESSGMVLGDPLKPIFHVTNFACAPTPTDTTTADERECSKDLEMAEVDKRRKDLLNPEKIFLSALLESKRNISLNQFMEFDTRLIPYASHFAPEIYPACFKNVSSWINAYKKKNRHSFEVSFIPAIYRKMVDANGKIRPHVEPAEQKTIRVKFGPKDLHNLKKSTVTVEDATGRAVYPDMVACP